MIVKEINKFTSTGTLWAIMHFRSWFRVRVLVRVRIRVRIKVRPIIISILIRKDYNLGQNLMRQRSQGLRIFEFNILMIIKINLLYKLTVPTIVQRMSYKNSLLQPINNLPKEY